MREIKFRAWDNMKKEMFYALHPAIKDTPVWNSPFWDKIETDPDNYILMQFTGLKDKNGKDIYEGDVVAFTKKEIYQFLDREDNKPREWICIEKKEGENERIDGIEKVIYGRRCLIVKWQDDLTGFYPFADSPDNCGHCGGGYPSRLFEVIGNIYENPDLLPS